MKLALVTGAGGFIGSALCERFVRSAGRSVRSDAARRSSRPQRINAATSRRRVRARMDEWFDGVSVAYHLAGRAHRHDRGTELERYELLSP